MNRRHVSPGGDGAGSGETLKYFAYGSNMSRARLVQRVGTATYLGLHFLPAHDLRFHKVGKDGSAKCDAHFTGNPEDHVIGVLFDIPLERRGALDSAEGLGNGYEQKQVTITSEQGNGVSAFTYYATHIDSSLLPFSWYLHHVVMGAVEFALPEHYIREQIRSVSAWEDPDVRRDQRERAVHPGYTAPDR